MKEQYYEMTPDEILNILFFSVNFSYFPDHYLRYVKNSEDIKYFRCNTIRCNFFYVLKMNGNSNFSCLFSLRIKLDSDEAAVCNDATVYHSVQALEDRSNSGLSYPIYVAHENKVLHLHNLCFRERRCGAVKGLVATWKIKVRSQAQIF
jgi:hypothetical protein